MSQTLARRARIKDLSNKAEGIFQYVGNDNVLFRLISTGNKLTSDVNYAVALFTGFARSHQLGSQETRQYQDKNGNNRTATEVLAAEVGFCGPKAADKPATASYEKQTANHVREANAAHSAPQQPQSYAQGSVDDFAEISDADDLPF